VSPFSPSFIVVVCFPNTSVISIVVVLPTLVDTTVGDIPLGPLIFIVLGLGLFLLLVHDILPLLSTEGIKVTPSSPFSPVSPFSPLSANFYEGVS